MSKKRGLHQWSIERSKEEKARKGVCVRGV